MARWYRSGRYYGRNRGYRRRTVYFNRSIRSKSWGNMKAAKQQADQSTFTINIPSTCSCFLKTNSNDAITGNEDPKSMRGVYAMNIFEQLRKSSFYQSYANMYDEFKIDRIKVKLLPSSFTYTATAGNNENGGTYKNVTIYTAWDRTGLNADQVQLNASALSTVATEIGKSDDSDGLYTTIGSNITTYSSAESRIINPGANTSITRWLNPKTIVEKGQWISTSSLKKWYDSYDDDKGRYCGIITGYTGLNSTVFNGDVEIEDDITIVQQGESPSVPVTDESISLKKINALNSENPCYLTEDPAIKFKPTLLVSTYPPVPANKNNICTFNVETEVVCTFRGLRKASVVAA